MRDRALLFVLWMSLSGAAQAQAIWQPTPAPLVTAESTTWFSTVSDPLTPIYNPTICKSEICSLQSSIAIFSLQSAIFSVGRSREVEGFRLQLPI
jgi:hypothetical protein